MIRADYDRAKRALARAMQDLDADSDIEVPAHIGMDIIEARRLLDVASRKLDAHFQQVRLPHWPLCKCGHIAQDHNGKGDPESCDVCDCTGYAPKTAVHPDLIAHRKRIGLSTKGLENND